jgi:hypothetical protein
MRAEILTAPVPLTSRFLARSEIRLVRGRHRGSPSCYRQFPRVLGEVRLGVPATGCYDTREGQNQNPNRGMARLGLYGGAALRGAKDCVGDATLDCVDSLSLANRTAPETGARGSGGMSWLPSPGNVRLPLHRRDRERRSLARTDPAGRGKSAWVRKPVSPAPTVGYLQGDVFVEWSAVDRKPSIIVPSRPRLD